MPDTKFDLAVAPAEFLSRALHLWDAQGAFGQLQNQAYGYLWPMGPFFLVGWLAAVPGWVVQRLWLGLVMSVAFAGTAKVSRALGVRSDLACLLAGLAFAFSPRMLTTLGPISIEAWPGALAPWVLLPLVTGSTWGSPRRAAALSALAVAMVGGVNAAATFAVVPLGAIWLLTRTPGPRRRSLMLWWPVFTLLGTLWWLVPLFVMGSYSPPFLDFIETTSVTTYPTTIFDALRGTSNWVPYLDAGSRAGNDLITTSYLALNSGVVLLLGFAGLIDRRTPHRLFLALGVLVGLLMVTAGHHGSVVGWWHADVQSALDGMLAPLRNVHKFDPVIRLPLVLGLAFVADRAVGAWRSLPPGTGVRDTQALLARVNQAVFLGVAMLVVVAAAMPAYLGRIAPAGVTLGVPGYWQQAADWLAEHDADPNDGGSLLVPGSPFGEYIWGAPRDEPLQWLAKTPWAVRNVIPLTPPGNIRMLDGIEDALAEGRGSAGLTDYLRRAGVEYLVVRNDLERGGDVPDPLLVHQAIADSPGIALVASFGPVLGGAGHLDSHGTRVLVNGGWQAPYRAVEIYRLADVAAAVTGTRTPVVAGGPEDLLDLHDLGVIDEQPTVLAADADPDSVPPGGVVLTDGLRARERFFGRIHDGASAAITPGDVRRSGSPARDYLVDRDDRWSTTVRLSGARGISASSSESDSTEIGGARRGSLPYAAVDGSADTAWTSGLARDELAWWRIDLDRPVEPAEVRVTGGPGNPANLTVRLRTNNGVSDPVRLGAGVTRTLDVPAGPTSWLRVEEVGASSGTQLSLAEVDVPGVRVQRALVLPTLPAAWGDPGTVVLRSDLDPRTGCVRVGEDVRCVPGRSHTGEEETGMARVVTLSRAATYPASIRVVPRAGPALDELVLAGQPVDVSASSVLAPDPRDSPVAALDGDRGTTWISRVDDARPTLRLSWIGEEVLRGIHLSLDRDADARLPTQVELGWPGGHRTVDLKDGRARFPGIRTDQLTITVTGTKPAYSLDFDAQPSGVGVGITELRLRGLPYLPLGLSLDPTTLPCGTGPEIRVGARTYPTRVVGAPRALAQGAQVKAKLCRSGRHSSTVRSVDLSAGGNTIAATSSPAFTLGSIVLGRNRVSASPPDAATITAQGPVRRVVEPGPGARVLDLRQNVNPGWQATQDGRALDPVTLDGWQQGWVLDSADEPVVATFAPDRAYRAGLVAGAGALLGLLAIALLTRRRWRGRDPLPLSGRRISLLVLVPVVGAGVGLVAGWAGVAVAAVVAPLAVLAQRRWPEAAAWVLAAPCVVAAAAYAVHPWGDPGGWAGDEAWPHYLMLVPVVAALSSVGWRLPTRTAFRRSAGRSTSR